MLQTPILMLYGTITYIYLSLGLVVPVSAGAVSLLSRTIIFLLESLQEFNGSEPEQQKDFA